MKKIIPVDVEEWQGGKKFCRHLYYVNKDGTTDCPACQRIREKE